MTTPEDVLCVLAASGIGIACPAAEPPGVRRVVWICRRVRTQRRCRRGNRADTYMTAPR
ncbi:hypothetical protein LPH50_10155 [Xylella taiwanensis]|nr:hypothetical protein [Xylella taiwanensis]MCD8463106.1 hypothetical protein [Xylella taiwanensis]MCD8470564.1 hypothetical protein [Xylella taiwanensis]UFM93450.1 hypothetical protein LPH39_10170 [Xylella taiwanensis]UFN02035.1 hypothetical protein LPH43_10235 [Xylella taiwanensis]UFN06501.1 hypothetical protein LPH42_10035 [Xylella taiwanensis]